AALSVLFRWLLRHRRVAVNPCVGVWRPPAPPARERVLGDEKSETELRWFWRACEQLHLPFGPALKLLLLTGWPLNEVARMRRSQTSEEGSTWIIPGERTRNHRPHIVPLSARAHEIITAVPRIEGKAGYVFTTTGTSPISGWSKTKAALDD